MLTAVAFTTGVMLGPAVRPLASSISVVLLAAIGLVAARRGRRVAPLFLAAAGFLGGFVASWAGLPRDGAAAALLAARGRDATVLEGVVREAPELGLDADALIVEAEGDRGDVVRVRVRVPHREEPPLSTWTPVPEYRPRPCANPGARVRLEVELRPLAPALYPLLRTRSPAVRRGVTLAAETRGPEGCSLLPAGGAVGPGEPEVHPVGGGGVRGAIARAIDRGAPPASAAMLRALATGDRTGLARVEEVMLHRAGLSHLFASWGIAAAALTALSFLVLTRATGSARIAALASVPLALLGASAHGADLSAARVASVLVALLLALAIAGAAPAEERSTRVWSGLAVSVIVCLALDPAGLGDVAYQLPFAAVAASLRTYPALAAGLERWILGRSAERGGARGTSLAAVRVVALMLTLAIGTAPLVARLFDRPSLSSLAANVIALPLATFVVTPLAILGGLAGAVSDALGAPLLHLAALGLGALRGLARWLIAHPGSSISAPGMLECLLFYAVTISLSLGNRRAGLVAAAALVMAIGAAELRARPDGALSASFLPVSRGSAALIELPDGGAVAFSTAPPSAGLDLGERTLANYTKLRRHEHLRAIWVPGPRTRWIEAARDLSHQLDAREIWWSAEAREVPASVIAGFDPGARHRFLGRAGVLDAGGARVALASGTLSFRLGAQELSIGAEGWSRAGELTIDARGEAPGGEALGREPSPGPSPGEPTGGVPVHSVRTSGLITATTRGSTVSVEVFQRAE